MKKIVFILLLIGLSFTFSGVMSSTSAKTSSIHIYVNGEIIKTDVAPQMINGTVMITAKSIAEALGAKAKWDKTNQAVIIYEPGTPQIASDLLKKKDNSGIRLFVNGQLMQPIVAPQKISGQVMVPAEFIAELLGVSVDWDSKGQNLIINKRDIGTKKSSSQIVSPFDPTDVFLFAIPGWDGYDSSVAQKTHASIFGNTMQGENSSRLEQYFINSEILSEVTSICHKDGLKYTAHFTTDNSDDTYPYQSESAVLDIDGNIITHFMATETPRIWKSIHYPSWKSYMTKLAENAVDSGVDIIAIDTWTLNYDVLRYGGDFSENSLVGFRDYLKGKYSAKQLSNLGIKDINTFDYGKYIKKSYLTEYKKGNTQNVPLYNDFKDFQLVSSKSFWHDIVDETRKYAAANGKKVTFTAGVPQSDYIENIHGLPIVDEVDGFISEFLYEFPPNNKIIADYKVFKSMGKPIVYTPNAGRSGDVVTRTDFTNIAKIFTAEAYASGEFDYVLNNILQNSSDGWNSYGVNMDEMYPYYDFIDNNKALYDNITSTAKTAVLYSYATVKNKESLSESFYGISNYLLDNHRQYDVLFAGDNKWISDKLNLDMLNQYDTIIMPNVQDISDKQIDLILKYIKLGGKVFAFGETGINDESGIAKDRPQLKALLTEGSHRYGLGQLVYMKDDAGTAYVNDKNSSILKKVTGIMDDLIDENINTNASQKVTLLDYRITSIDSEIIHLINYDYNDKAGHINQQKNITMNVTLNSKLLGKDLGVYYVSPDWSGTKELKYSIVNNKISFVLPYLDTYGVIYIGEKPSNGKKYDDLVPTPTSEPTPIPTLAPTTAPTPTLAPTPEPVMITGDNLLQNPGFEDGTLSSWENNSCNVTASNTHSGAYSVQISNLNTGVWQTVAVEPNTTYLLAGWIKNTKVGDKTGLGVKGYGDALTFKNTDITSTSYSQAVLTFTTGPSSTSVAVLIWKDGGTDASYADDISLTESN